MTIPCSQCPYAADAGWSATRPATIWWHRGQFDEEYVCKRCYQRLYMRARQGRPIHPERDS